jgi:hypothetical protein
MFTIRRTEQDELSDRIKARAKVLATGLIDSMAAAIGADKDGHKDVEPEEGSAMVFGALIFAVTLAQELNVNPMQLAQGFATVVQDYYQIEARAAPMDGGRTIEHDPLGFVPIPKHELN